jgi:hypothetical protein
MAGIRGLGDFSYPQIPAIFRTEFLMSIVHDPNILPYAVVEYLKSSEHIYDPVDGKPELAACRRTARMER